MTAIGRLVWTAIDCPDARSLAHFYSAITGWPIDEDTSSERWVELRSDGGATICFQGVEDYVASATIEAVKPGGGQQSR